MKDPSYTEAWVDALVWRLRGGRISPNSPEWDLPSLLNGKQASDQAATASSTNMAKCKMARVSIASLAALRTLPREANILLFTPAIVPAGNAETYRRDPHMDPFEPFGKALSKHHKHIRHVPYVAKTGFADIHQAFVSQADAVITVVCEPCNGKHDSLENQMDFAEQALDALESKEANASHTLVLVECGDDEFRPPVDASFMNVIESASYNDEVAKQIAYAIFKGCI